jgi:hypothetical protein
VLHAQAAAVLLRVLAPARVADHALDAERDLALVELGERRAHRAERPRGLGHAGDRLRVERAVLVDRVVTERSGLEPAVGRGLQLPDAIAVVASTQRFVLGHESSVGTWDLVSRESGERCLEIQR